MWGYMLIAVLDGVVVRPLLLAVRPRRGRVLIYGGGIHGHKCPRLTRCSASGRKQGVRGRGGRSMERPYKMGGGALGGLGGVCCGAA